LLLIGRTAAWADDFTVERAVNLNQLNSWANIRQFQWQKIDHGIQDNRQEMDAQNYVYIMPPIGETQLEVKIWPQGEGEEKAKTYTFHSHSWFP
jgi:hypothetical protein